MSITKIFISAACAALLTGCIKLDDVQEEVVIHWKDKSCFINGGPCYRKYDDYRPLGQGEYPTK